ncbi:MAG: V-type ATPase subunit [Clostridia bacterium]|nr:V-type ATPase subunit [Clostridia bacterium]
MKDTEFAYAVARVRSNENKLLSSATVESLINSSDYNEALKLLADAGYENIDASNEDEILSKILKQAVELIYSSAPDDKCLDFLIVKNDYHNIKALIKCLVSDKNPEKLLLSPSIFDSKAIENALKTKDYSALPHFLAEHVREAYELVTKTMDGQLLEVFLDKKSIETSILLAKGSKDSFSVSLAELMCLIADLKIALRCAKTVKDEDFIMKALAQSSMVDVRRLCSSSLDGADALSAYVDTLGYTSLSEAMKKGYACFERACDDLIMEKVKDAKYQCLGIAPLVAYYFAVDAEIKNVRIVLSCKKNGIDSDIIRERVRVLYA